MNCVRKLLKNLNYNHFFLGSGGILSASAYEKFVKSHALRALPSSPPDRKSSSLNLPAVFPEKRRLCLSGLSVEPIEGLNVLATMRFFWS